MGARQHDVAEWILAAVAIVLTAVVVVSSMFSHPNPKRGLPATDRPAAAPSTAPAPTSTMAAKPSTNNPASVVRVGFEADLAGWRPIGAARLQRDPRAHQGRWAARVTGSRLADQGMALPAVLRCTPGKAYAASVWVRADRPATLVEVNLLEVVGGRRYATDSVGAVLESGDWQRVEVAHLAHRPGATLAVEVVLPRGSPRASVLVDELEVTVHRASFMSSG
jgi:carbohydrate binding protein with CBM4/9 domain